jgi:hypothetical protein
MVKNHFTQTFKTPLGDVSIVITKKDGSLCVEFLSLFGRKDVKVPVDKVKEILQEFTKWISEV